MSVLDHVLANITMGEPTIWAAIIATVGAIIGAVLGGVIGGLLAVWAAMKGAKRASADNRERDEKTTNDRAIALVQAIQTEAHSLWLLLDRQIVPGIRLIDERKPLTSRYVIGDGYFTIYESSAALLGTVSNIETRKHIVEAYIAARSFIDTIKMNNQLAAKYDEVTMNLGVPPSVLDVQRAMAFNALCSFSGGIVDALRVLEAKLKVFFASTNEWLQSKGAETNPGPSGAREETDI